MMKKKEMKVPQKRHHMKSITNTSLLNRAEWKNICKLQRIIKMLMDIQPMMMLTGFDEAITNFIGISVNDMVVATSQKKGSDVFEKICNEPVDKETSFYVEIGNYKNNTKDTSSMSVNEIEDIPCFKDIVKKILKESKGNFAQIELKSRVMGGHGGLNILPQKKWNVYNFENREKVRKDEEAAAKEEQIKREQSRKRDAEFRLQKLRLAKGIQAPSPPPDHPSSSSAAVAVSVETTTTTTNDSNHINLFEGLKDFPFLAEIKESGGKGLEEEKGFKRKKLKREEEKKKEDKVVVSAEDEKYKLGYGLAGKGVKAPWYLSKKPEFDDGDDQIGGRKDGKKQEMKNKSGKKTVEELREERLKRERREKEREFVLRDKNKRKDGFGYKVRNSY